MTPIDTLQDLLARARSAGADGADAVMFSSADMSCSCRMGKPESIERAENSGLGLRVFVGKKQAVVSSSDFSPATLEELAERAVSMAKIAPEDEWAALASREQFARNIPDLDLFDPHEPEAAWLAEQAAKTEATALAVAGITNSEGAEAGYSQSRIALATSEGFAHSYATSSFTLSLSVLAGTGQNMERDFDYSATRHLSDLDSPEKIGRNAAEKTLARLGARKAKSAQVPIIFDPKIAKGLVGVFSGAISGAAIARGTSFLKDEMGKPVFAPHVTIVDDPHIRRALGSRPFDAEGVQNGRRNLVENGVLQSWLLDLRSARKLGLEPTGDAARGTASPPMPSSSNLYMAAGELSPEALMADIKEGVYITDTFGSGSNLITGDISVGASGFWIENGRKAYAVNEFTIAGNLRDMYKNLIPANDLAFRYATNAPTLRVEGMTVSGA